MRRILPLATIIAASGMLSGCAGSGFYAYLGDTFRVPFHSDPNKPAGNSEVYAKVLKGAPETPAAPMLYEAGDVWPPPPKAPPTLKDLQAQSTQDLANGNGTYKPLQPLPALPGYEVPEPQAHMPIPSSSFPTGNVPVVHGHAIGTGGGTNLNTNGLNGSIIVPNGNGTSTVIGPNGSVTTVPTPNK
jgi:hypothetical protein